MSSNRRSIEQTLSRLSWGTDRREMAYIKDCYTSDARWIRHHEDGSKDELVGRDAIVAHIEGVWAKNAPKLTKHVVTNTMIEGATGSQARATSYKILFRVEDGTPVLASVGTYNDVFVNEDGTWRIKERVVVPEGST